MTHPLAGVEHDLLQMAAETLAARPPQKFSRGETYVPVSGKVIGEYEYLYALLAVADGHFTEGRWTDEFEGALERFYGLPHALFVNSGSSANLLAVSTLFDKASFSRADLRSSLKRGDAVVTAAVGFPTTVNPLLQNGLRVELVDVEPETYVPSLDAILEAVEQHRAKAVVMAHTLGNPWPVARLVDLRTDLLVVEDNCDAFGSRLGGRLTGTMGDVATQSFYPAHHITTGEGGAVVTASGRLARVAESLRDWGRSCYCPPGKENTCGKRFEWDFAPLPLGTDHKYVYDRIGYNLKATDMQAAIGCAQMLRAEAFIAKRRQNFDRLHAVLADYGDIFVLPRATDQAEVSWFGFPLTLRPGQPYTREDLCRWLEGERRIATRPLFAGFLPWQPAYREVFDPSDDHFPASRQTGLSAFWVGVWPGLGDEQMDWIAESLAEAAQVARQGARLPAGGA